MLSKSVYLGVIVILAMVLLVRAQMVTNHQSSAYYYHGRHYRYYHKGWPLLLLWQLRLLLSLNGNSR